MHELGGLFCKTDVPGIIAKNHREGKKDMGRICWAKVHKRGVEGDLLTLGLALSGRGVGWERRGWMWLRPTRVEEAQSLGWLDDTVNGHGRASLKGDE